MLECQKRKRRRGEASAIEASDTSTKLDLMKQQQDKVINFIKLNSNLNRMSKLINSRFQVISASLITTLILINSVNCQQPQQLARSSPQLQELQNFIPTPANELSSEPRAEAKPNSIDQLVANYLFNYANNQPQRRPQLQTNSNQQQPQMQQVSTPVNPFLNQQQQQQQFQSNRQAASNNNFRNQPTGASINNRPFAQSAPPTPYLTLNKIASLTSHLNRVNFNQMMQPSSQQQPPNRVLQIPLGPARGMQPIGQRQPFPPNQSQRPDQLTQALPMPAIMNVNNLIRPLGGGFAPSGPPPTNLATPNMVNGGPNLSQAEPAKPSPAATTTIASTAGEQQPTTSYSTPETSSQAASATTTATTTTTASSSGSSQNSSPSSSTSKSAGGESQAASSERPPASDAPTSEQASNQELSWNPVELNRTSTTTSSVEAFNANKVTLAPSPDIVTVPPGYNPDNPRIEPQNYDIAVSAQMGGSAGKQLQMKPLSFDSGPEASGSSSANSSAAIITVAPTATTTIIWSPPPAEVPNTAASSAAPIEPTKSISPTSSMEGMRTSPPSRIRDNSMLNDEPPPAEGAEFDQRGVVYGKPVAKDSKPTAPPANRLDLAPSPVTGQASIESSIQGRPFIQPVQLDNQVRPYLAGTTQAGSQQGQRRPTSAAGLPFKPSKQINGPQLQQTQSAGNIVNSGFTITSSGNQTMPIGDIQDYVANQPPMLVPASGQEPTISAHGGQDPASFELGDQSGAKSFQNDSLLGPSGRATTTTTTTTTVAPPSAGHPRLRRPTFKPKPAVPPIRIDSCIVGDDSSCDQSHNERCVTEYGISSCHCKPGYARLSQLRGYCNQVSSLQLSMRIDRLSDDRKLVFNQTLDNSNSEEYQYLEFETIQALASAFQLTSLSKQFMGARVNRFYERKGKVWVNATINFELNNITRVPEKIPALAQQELAKVISQFKAKPLGDSTIILDATTGGSSAGKVLTSGNSMEPTISKLVDINECASKDLNDCSKFATCSNEFGGFSCQCLPGYEDKYQKEEDKGKHGRVCLGCSANYCSNRGECFINEGRKQCKCKANFIGARCDIDSEVLAVAIGGSLVGVVILIITFWCLYVFNKRWKREQQKMDAMSATSGLTFNYVNSSTNTLMSPANGRLARSAQAANQGPLAAVGGQQLGAIAANYGQRLGGLVGRSGGQHHHNQHHQQHHHHNLNHYATDQQAIIGSTSSGSSAASQPINSLYHPVYADEHAGLLIAPASNGSSSEQASPSSYTGGGNVNRAFVGNAAMLMPGNAYTLSGHHHHHHHHQNLMLEHHNSAHHQHHHKSAQLSQFHPAADYNTGARPANNSLIHCPSNNMFDSNNNRWRTLQQSDAKQQQQIGYYLSPDMLVGGQQQLYASPQRELCIDTGDNNRSRRHQSGRAGNGFQTTRSRSHQRNSTSMYIDPEYEHERRI